MRHRPDVQRHHARGCALVGGQAGVDAVGRFLENGEGAVGLDAEGAVGAGWNAGFEHRGIERGFLAREGEIGAPDPFQRAHRVRLARVPRAFQRVGELA